MILDLQSLHAAGADVSGENGAAWLRFPAIKNERTKGAGLLGRIRYMRALLNRPVTPSDMEGIQ
jgi:hypothetical protein